MSLATAALARMQDRVYAHFGAGASYLARDAAAVAVTVLIESDLSRFGDVATVAGKTVAINVRASEVPAMPRSGDVFQVTGGEYAGRTFRVDSVLSSDAYEHKALAA